MFEGEADSIDKNEFPVVVRGDGVSATIAQQWFADEGYAAGAIKRTANRRKETEPVCAESLEYLKGDGGNSLSGDDSGGDE